jgi:sucrose-phosphate synthase
LGRPKQGKLLAQGMPHEEIVKRFKIDRRISAEEEILAQADLVVTSTAQEVREQYGQYHNGRRPDFCVIPPGLDVERFYPFYHDLLPEKEPSESALYARASVLQELNRFLSHPDKPLILALCRPDKRKNISGLIRAFGEDRELQAMANLAIFAGLRKDIEAMEDNEREVLTRMLLLMDKYDLYGKLAIPKKHDFESEVPALYRLTAEKQGVFVNPALTEPFGLTLLEASATGLPIVATQDGGPQDILKNCQNGILVDAASPSQIGGAIKKIIADKDRWHTYSKNGVLNVRRHYTWQAHAESYLKEVKRLARQADTADLSRARPTDAIGRRLTRLQYLFVTDIDHTLIGEDNHDLGELLALLETHRDQVGFAVATGRTAASAVQHLKAHGITAVDVVIAAVGSEIYYGPQALPSRSWATHITSRWDRRKVVAALEGLRHLTYQEEETQRPFKVSYFMRPGPGRLEAVQDRLSAAKCKFQLIYSHQRYLDILPYRASKGKAIRFLSYKWGIPLAQMAVSGDSGNDAEMLRGEPLGVVVGNHSPELAPLRRSKRVYFAQQACAGGILEGLRKYRFFEKAREACDAH